MKTSIRLYSTENGEINRFLTAFYQKEIEIQNNLKYNIEFENPVEMVDLISTFIENKYKFKLNIWISFDKGIYINITEHNADKIIRYIYERYPY